MGLLSAMGDLWATAAAPVVLSLLTVASAATMASVVRWVFARCGVTEAAVRALYDNDALKKLMYPRKPLDAEWDQEQWGVHEREVLLPAIDAIECFAALTNARRWPWPWHSFRVVKRMASQRLISLWELRDVQHVVRIGREASPDPATTYLEFELLVVSLKISVCRDRRQRNALKKQMKLLRGRLMP